MSIESKTLLTIPNLLCAIRLLGSPVLVVLAWLDLAYWCFGLFLFLLLTDWLDGKLATLLKQQTTFGARLDSVADAAFYACLLLAMYLLKGDVIRDEAVWIGAAILTYFVSVVAAVLKFGSIPSYHTLLAKTSWLLITVALIALFAGWSDWPLRIAMAVVCLANLEAIVITCILSQRRVNVLTVFHARLVSPKR